MSITLREDITYILLEKLSRSIADENRYLKPHDIRDRQINRSEILMHLKYLRLWGYVKAESDISAEPEALIPSAETISLHRITLTQQGHQFFKRLMANSPYLLESSPSLPCVDLSMPLAI